MVYRHLQPRHLCGEDARAYVATLGTGAAVTAGVETGGLQVLRGDEKGIWKSYTEIGNSIGVDANFGVIGTKYYYGGKLNTLSFKNAFAGNSWQANFSAGVGFFDVGVSLSRSTKNIFGYRTYGLGGALGASPSPINVNGSMGYRSTILD